MEKGKKVSGGIRRGPRIWGEGAPKRRIEIHTPISQRTLEAVGKEVS